ncbi:MAG: hypothetical protein CMQ19_11615 [Gammaproteobacteria bacterium]|nr:hypothetical protein [Gammaproteobacteria bacterium]|tara:strand:- start:121 stop:546 length:426 start_codon:yes stop_codon:yes gene_type:complete
MKLKTGLYKPLGFLFLGLAFLGVLLPILPATPFLLLSGWFFARSSEKWHQWLLKSDLFGPILKNWEEGQCISLKTKIVALVMMAIAGAGSIFFALDNLYLRIFTGVFLLIGTITVLSIKTCPSDMDCDEQAPLKNDLVREA